jgi:nickel/cobalt transporter (NicO) family protein
MWSKARAAHKLFMLAIIVTAVLFLTGLVDAAWAQNSPFAGLRSGGGSQSVSAAGIVGWLFAKQAEFYRQFSGLIAKGDPPALPGRQ